MRLLLVRHGQTAWHASSRHVGKMDIPLDETGKKQAELNLDSQKDTSTQTDITSIILYTELNSIILVMM